jgi:hypothetical protein
MPAQWIVRLGERLLHQETFTLMLSPAIADVQFETLRGGRPRPGHYASMLKAFVGALCCDVADDIQSLRDDVPTVAILTMLQTSYYSFMLVLLSGFGGGKISTQDLDGPTAARALLSMTVLLMACLATTMACFWPPRRTHSIDG